MDGERRKKLRTFGLILGVILAVVGWRLRVKGHAPWALAAWAAALASTAAAWLKPEALDGVERRWLFVALKIGRVNTYILLTIMYYLFLTPLALLMRAVSGDPLDRGWGPGSYWKKRTSGEDLKSYEKQF
jgi:hypothetical protein